MEPAWTNIMTLMTGIFLGITIMVVSVVLIVRSEDRAKRNRVAAGEVPYAESSEQSIQLVKDHQ